jgi:hypothetical protein
VCLLDLDYNLPVQVRDQALAEAGEVIEALPQSDAGREYALNAMSKEGMTTSSFAKAAGNDTIMRLQRTTPYYKVLAVLRPFSWHMACMQRVQVSESHGHSLASRKCHSCTDSV